MFYRNTVEISENSENHLKAIVGGRQVAGRDRLRESTGKRGKKATGRRKSGLPGGRCWHSGLMSANYMDLRDGFAESHPFGFDQGRLLRKERARVGHTQWCTFPLLANYARNGGTPPLLYVTGRGKNRNIRGCGTISFLLGTITHMYSALRASLSRPLARRIGLLAALAVVVGVSALLCGQTLPSAPGIAVSLLTPA